MNYQIVRFRQHPDHSISRRILKTDLTLEDALKHCHDPETSSSTCSAKKRNSVRHKDPWFDAYEEQKGRK